MPKTLTKPMQPRRPWMERIYGERDFVVAAMALGYQESRAAAVWQHVVQAVKGARYNRTAALAEYLVRGQLTRFIGVGRPSRMQDEQWNLLIATAKRLGLTV